jgi:DNA-binding transcriptional ArsR family regulator
MSIQPLSLSDLAELLPRLQATVELLSGKARAAATTNGKSKRGGGRGRRGGSVDGEAVREKLLSALKGAKKGLSLSELTKKLKLSDNVVGYNLRQLRGQKKTKLVGSRRQARWFAQ